jgi:ribosomal protein L37E
MKLGPDPVVACPKCGRDVFSSQARCSNCGWTVGLQPAEPAPKGTFPMIPCPKCERSVFSTEASCSNCGWTRDGIAERLETFEDEKPTQRAPTEPSFDAKYVTNRMITHLYIIFVVIPVVAALIYVLSHS